MTRKAYAAPFGIDNELSTEEIISLIREFFSIGVYDLAVTGGEPLCRKDWREIVRFASNIGEWKLTLNTNGILWEEEDIKFVAEHCESIGIIVSLDGYSPRTYGVLRKDGHHQGGDRFFAKVVKNVKLMKEYGLKVSINYTITSLTINNFFETLEFIRHLRIDGFLAIKFFPYGRGKVNFGKLEINYDDWESFIFQATRSKESDPSLSFLGISTTCPWEFYIPLMRHGYTQDDIERIWDYNTPLASKSYSSMRDLGCHAGITSCAISPDGSVFPCGTVSARIPGLFCGNVRERSFLEIWEDSEMFKKLRSLELNKLKGHCSKCQFKELCGGGCRARAYVLKGGLDEVDPICPYHLSSNSYNIQGRQS
ncbi:MAG: putative mycofactocin radical SAM maturase MftC [Dehalococcoidia bacterium]|nr:putative mycofactocin radical SAM maturase MftC [Bacillota bacterium]